MESTALVPPLLANVHKIDLEAGSPVHIQCRICLETQGTCMLVSVTCLFLEVT